MKHVPEAAPGKFNDWCQRRPLVCNDMSLLGRANAYAARKDLSPSEGAAFFLHELAGCAGLEFVAFSNAILEDPVVLSHGVVLVPCFLSDSEVVRFDDPLAQYTALMRHRNRFVYDGWIPIATWEDDGVRESIRRVDEALSIFGLRTSASFDWEPKYPGSRQPVSVYKFEVRHLQELEAVARGLDSLSEDDRNAIYRSLAWLSQSIRVVEPAARFLFSILAIESLATHIEKKDLGDSPLSASRVRELAATESDQEQERDRRIDEILSEWLKKDAAKAISQAYSECVMGNKRRLKQHLEHVFNPDKEPTEMLFARGDAGPCLYDLRNKIAHGSADVLSEAERESIQRRIYDAERIARRYICLVLEKSLSVGPFSPGMKASFSLGIANAVCSHEGMFQGPTHMAEIYA